MKYYYRLRFEIKHLIYKLRLFSVILKNDSWYDMDGLYHILAFKAKVLREKGCHLDEGYTVASLRIVEKLCNKISSQQRSFAYHRRMDIKWGKLSHKSIPDGKYYRIEFNREKALTDEQKKEMVQDMRNGSLLTEQCHARDINTLFGILAKYIQRMWD